MEKLEKGDVEFKKGNVSFYANMIAKELGMPKEDISVIAEAALSMDKIAGTKTQLTPQADKAIKALKNDKGNPIAGSPVAQVLKVAEAFSRTMGDETDAGLANKQNENAMRQANDLVARGLAPQECVDALKSGIAKYGNVQQAQLAAKGDKFGLEGGERASVRDVMAANKAAYEKVCDAVATDKKLNAIPRTSEGR